MRKFLFLTMFDVFRYSIVVGAWFCIDDTLAEHFECDPIGTVPMWVVIMVPMIMNLIGQSGIEHYNDTR